MTATDVASLGTAFVTGGSGFVGGAVVRHLVAGGVPVRALARSAEAEASVASLGASPVRGSILDEPSLRDAMDGCDVVFHVAGINAACVRDPGPMYAANVSGPERVVRAAAAAGIARVVHTSSAAAVAEAEGTVGTEHTEPSGTFATHYARSKYLGERHAFAAGRDAGVEVVAVNPSSVQGPGRTSGTAKLLLGVARTPVAVLVRTWLSIVDVDDCARAHLLAAIRGATGERYLVSGSSVTSEEAVALLRGMTGAPRRVLWVPRSLVRAATPVAGAIARIASGDPPLCAEMLRTLLHGHRYDGSRATRELGLSYTPLEETFRRALEWYEARGMLGRNHPA
ncbi:MAG TPA: NAD-dependent epimerase/dehydratase family protein [Actinomycetota bacterium]|nr:NAD-dependent epimerase/dehydratase family protein [Actinomycetota bacterium]